MCRFPGFHGLLTAVCLYAAVTRLRSRSARQVAGLVPKKARTLRPAPHPPIKDRPVFWKEVYCEAKPRQRWLALLFTRDDDIPQYVESGTADLGVVGRNLVDEEGAEVTELLPLGFGHCALVLAVPFTSATAAPSLLPST